MDKVRDKDIIYFLLNWLFLLIILPKFLQLIVIIFVVIYCMKKNEGKFYIDKAVIPFLTIGIINVLSIALNCVDGYHEFDRILAGFNTSLLWILGSILYSYIKKMNIDREIINKAMFKNIIILVIFAFLTFLIQPNILVKFSIFSRKIIGFDWIHGEQTYRMTGFMEYPNLIVLFYLLSFPFAFEYVASKNKAIYQILFCILASIPPFLTNSRIGIVLIILLNFWNIIHILITNKKENIVILFTKNKKKKMAILFIALIIIIICIVVSKDIIIEKMISLVSSRPDSTSQRMIIYERSIEKALNNHIIFGCGIKDNIGDYPLGSHSTYLGLFYKTGIIGFILGIIGFILIFKTLIKQKHKLSMVYIIYYIALLVMLITEDLDGANWCILLFFILMSTSLIERKKYSNSRKKISIIIPVYNCENYIDRGLNSVINQTIFEDLEIILINDGSKDKSLEKLQEYEKKYKNIKLINQENLGVSAARNAGLKKITGEYICFFDIDDEVEKDMYEYLRNSIEKNDCDIAVVDFVTIHSNLAKKKYRKNTKKTLENDEIMIDFLMGKTIGKNLFDKIFKRKIIENINFKEGKRIGEDMFFVFEVLKHTKKVCIDTEYCGYKYYKNQMSAMNRKFDDRFFDTIELSKNILESYNKEDKLYNYAYAHYIHEICKVIEYMNLNHATSYYDKTKERLKNIIKKYENRDAKKYMSRRKYYAFILMKYSEKFYMFMHKIMKI